MISWTWQSGAHATFSACQWRRTDSVRRFGELGPRLTLPPPARCFFPRSFGRSTTLYSRGRFGCTAQMLKLQSSGSFET